VAETLPTIVVVEDEPEIRGFLRAALGSEGYRVVESPTGARGAVDVGTHKADLAIVDLGLPVMSGYDVARRLRANPAMRDVRLIAWSGYGQDTDVQAALEAGFHDHLTKPLDPDRLDEILAKASETPISG